MTPFLAFFNTIISLLLLFFFVLAAGTARDEFMMSYLIFPITVIFLLSIVTGWLVALKKASGNIIKIWRVTQTVSVLVLLILLIGTFAR